jgi:mannose-6-phosphate isomerase class I
MPDKRVLVTSKGCYAVNKNGVTVELEAGQEVEIEDVQANVFVKVGKAELIVNKPKQKAN